MARQTERDSYGGEHRWAQGAGMSWTSPYGGGEQQWRGGGSDSDIARAYELPYGSPVIVPKGSGPKGYRRSDERIREDLCERLWRDDHADVSEVSVDVKDGTVTLQGTVRERRMKHRIEDIAAACPGVRDVENRIRVDKSNIDA